MTDVQKVDVEFRRDLFMGAVLDNLRGERLALRAWQASELCRHTPARQRLDPLDPGVGQHDRPRPERAADDIVGAARR